MRVTCFKPSPRFIPACAAWAGLTFGLGAALPLAGNFAEPSSVAVRAPAAGCGNIRLDAPGGSMEHVRVRNQRSIGSCYAHAAAQVYDAWRFRHGDTEYEHSSAGFEISQRFKWDRDEQSVDGGHLKKIMPKLLAEGTCSQEELDSLFRGITLDQYASNVMHIFYRHRDAYKKTLGEHYATESKENSAQSQRFLERERLGYARLDNLRVDRSYEHGRFQQWLLSEQLKKGVAELKEYNKQVCVIANPHIPYNRLRADSNTVHMFEMISLAECPDQRKITAKGSFYMSDIRSHTSGQGMIPGFMDGKARFKPEVSLAVLDRELNRGLKSAYPVAISYCSSIFGQGRAYPTEAKFADPDAAANDCHRHASLVIGRRTNTDTGRCQYLIRNTWGNGCGSYSKDWNCDAAAGSVWIDADKLGQSIYRLQTVVTERD